MPADLSSAFIMRHCDAVIVVDKVHIATLVSLLTRADPFGVYLQREMRFRFSIGGWPLSLLVVMRGLSTLTATPAHIINTTLFSVSHFLGPSFLTLIKAILSITHESFTK